MTARPLFHVSRRHLGSRVVLMPKQPETACFLEEGLPPRVCFAPSVRHCLASMSGARLTSLVIGETVPRRRRVEGLWAHANPSVYQTVQRLRLPPQDRSDFAQTGERWALKPLEVEHVGFVCLATLTREGRVHVVSAEQSRGEELSQAYRAWDDDFLERLEGVGS